ncbi:MAG TPA: hypothetical protein VMG12_25010, partial [Polyangiaceae bacterium]|nr:hypothetical protein [Polyangiaceae bacterium]
MSFETSGTYARPSGDGAEPPHAQNGTQVFPLPPRPAENAGRAGAAAAPEVSVRATVGVGETLAPATPPRPVRRTPRDVNEPTRIFAISAAASDADGATPAAVSAIPASPHTASDIKANDDNGGGEVSRRTATFASPPFAPVPNSKVVARAVAKPSAPAPRPAVVHTTRTLSVQPAPAPKASGPLLRAFDGARASANTWSTAKTVNAPLPQVAEVEARAAASDVTKAWGKTAPRRTPKMPSGAPAQAGANPGSGVLPQLVASLKLSSPTRKISLVMLALTAVLSSGSFVGRAVAKKAGLRDVVSAAVAAPAKLAAAAKADAPRKSGAPASAVVPTSAAVAPATPVPAAVPRSAPAAAAPKGSASDVTLARRAVDAVIAGDRARALALYRELSRQ